MITSVVYDLYCLGASWTVLTKIDRCGILPYLYIFGTTKSGDRVGPGHANPRQNLIV